MHAAQPLAVVVVDGLRVADEVGLAAMIWYRAFHCAGCSRAASSTSLRSIPLRRCPSARATYAERRECTSMSLTSGTSSTAGEKPVNTGRPIHNWH